MQRRMVLAIGLLAALTSTVSANETNIRRATVYVEATTANYYNGGADPVASHSYGNHAFGGYGAFAPGLTGCCETQPSCCDNVWAGYCETRQAWCYGHRHWGCGGSGCGDCGKGGKGSCQKGGCAPTSCQKSSKSAQKGSCQKSSKSAQKGSCQKGKGGLTPRGYVFGRKRGHGCDSCGEVKASSVPVKEAPQTSDAPIAPSPLRATSPLRASAA